MKLNLTRTQWTAVTALALVAGAAGSAYWAFTGRDQGLQAAEDLAVCQALAARLKTLVREPTLARAQAMEQPELAGRIEAAAKAAGLSTSAVERIVPESPRRLSESDYCETAVQLSLRQATLRQVIVFLHTISGGGSGGTSGGNSGAISGGGGNSEGTALRVQAIRLSAPRGAESGDQWRVEATFTYLIYSPRPAPGVNSGATPGTGLTSAVTTPLGG